MQLYQPNNYVSFAMFTMAVGTILTVHIITVYKFIFTEFIPPSYVDLEDDGTKPDKTLKCNWMYPYYDK